MTRCYAEIRTYHLNPRRASALRVEPWSRVIYELILLNGLLRYIYSLLLISEDRKLENVFEWYISPIVLYTNMFLSILNVFFGGIFCHFKITLLVEMCLFSYGV